MSFVDARDRLLRQIRRELVGPAPAGPRVNAIEGASIEVPGGDRSRRAPYCQAETGEEILSADRPCKRYGIGVLFPRQQASQPEGTGALVAGGGTEGVVVAGAESDLEHLEALPDRDEGGGVEDLELSSTNDHQPSALGVSFFADVIEGPVFRATIRGGRYEPISVRVNGEARSWWRRVPVQIQVEIPVAELASKRQCRRVLDVSGALQLSVDAFARTPRDGKSLITFALVNRTPPPLDAVPDAECLFQTEFVVEMQNGGAEVYGIHPYPMARSSVVDDDEEAETALLYRSALTFAVGHGCAANWLPERPEKGRCNGVRADVLPSVELPSITPEIVRADGTRLNVSMHDLADSPLAGPGYAALQEVIDSYRGWIADRRGESAALGDHSEAANRNLRRCDRALERMVTGLEFLRRDAVAASAFSLANRAMALQQLRTSKKSPRKREYEAKSRRWTFSEPYEHEIPRGDRGNWRPFQVAFLLQALESTANGTSDDRDIVELIWFPTGGGKTEAYLGLAAFAILYRRLKALSSRTPNEDAGVHVVMRYTLRLLTAQQFQRAAALMCALETLRRQRSDLGREEFKIGIWVGGTPNKRAQAIAALNALERGAWPDHNIIVMDRCPWCRAELGVTEKKIGQRHVVHGYERTTRGGDSTVIARCPDSDCPFSQRLPLEFIDEDIYSRAWQPPSLLIGTVDKFAMLAYYPEARRIFGRDNAGKQELTPPGLILQDELHLISGPLGSMVGLYESVVAELCTDRRSSRGHVAPKVVTSTATIRGYKQQVRDVFGRDRVALFPPAGIDIADSFFGRYATERDGTRSRGRMHVGINAPALGSAQTVQVRAFTAALQGAAELAAPDRDPFWTLLVFYNSLRELGGGLTLFNSDIPNYLSAFRTREAISPSNYRYLNRVRELTGRLDDGEVNRALSDLEIAFEPRNKCVDVCLASNIIEVGVDVDRLSLMAVVGQPKTTAQYIQVTGRVGRRWWERPGIVLTLYGASKPRDRSHFEKFRTYHERLYAQVEPTSVTPFSRTAVERAAHGAMAAYLRQTTNMASVEDPRTTPAELISRATEVILERAEIVDPDEKSNVALILQRRVAELRKWNPQRWFSWASAEGNLLRWPGKHVPVSDAQRSWATPSSMRSVDAECALQISRLYGDSDV